MTSPSQQNEQVHEVAPPIEDNSLAVAIAAILLSGAALYLQVKEISLLLKPLGIAKQAVLLSLSVSGRSSVLPNNKPSAYGHIASTVTMKAARQKEALYRASYVISSSKRIQEDLDEKKPVRTVLADESMNYRQHAMARRGRLDSAARVAANEKLYGSVLGWYLNPLLNNEIECITANGHNFEAGKGTVIGLPGAVHPNCGCKSGPPWPGGMDNACDDYLPAVIVPAKPKLYSVRKQAS